MSDFSSVFHLVSEICQKEKISCVLIGGYAVNYYKVSRQTGDVDFMITKEGFERISSALKDEDYRQECLHDNFAQFKSTKLPLMDVDFMFVDQNTFDKILKEAVSCKIGKWQFVLPSLDHLIALKLHAVKSNYKLRWTKDLPDIINLVRINKVDVRCAKFKELCLKFGTVELYQKILEATDGRP